MSKNGISMRQENEKSEEKGYRRVVPNERLKKAREGRGWSLDELAGALGVDKKTVERWEEGATFPPSKKREQLRHLFDMDATALGLVRPELALPSFFHMLYGRNSYFTGREVLLSTLYNRLVEASEANLPLALCGLGGIGKTQLAVEYAYRSGNVYQAIFWIRADHHHVLVADFVDIASILDLPEQKDQNVDKVIHAVKRWFMSHTDWLLVLDNVEDLDSIAPFLFLNKQGHVLLTSRTQVVGTRAEKIDVDKMSLEEGVMFFLRRTKKIAHSMSIAQADAGQRKIAAKIVREMDGHPLALDQAGAYIEEEGCRIDEYLDLYYKQRYLLLQQRGVINSGHPESVVTTFLLSFKRVEQNNRLAAGILRLCAFVDPDAIPEELLFADSTDPNSVGCRIQVDRVTFHIAVGELLKYSLVRRFVNCRMCKCLPSTD
jgi:transcriptional regulator with XRE-family HTH domain